jgi:osmotically inducible protein OsmC
MKTLFTGEAISLGGRSGSVKTTDGLINTELGNPLEKGIEKRGPNPEQFFASAYAACYHGALLNAAKKLNVPAKDTAVRARVNLIEEDNGGFKLSVELRAKIPGADEKTTRNVMEEAHRTCPYSKLSRGESTVLLAAD